MQAKRVHCHTLRSPYHPIIPLPPCQDPDPDFKEVRVMVVRMSAILWFAFS
jgi:hypothetical protein